ncbi:MAG TPA: hypothetical protein VIJ07_18885 [Dermatophilaceae bacterium]
MGLSAGRPPNRDEQRLNGALLGHPPPDSHLHCLADPVVIGHTRDDQDPEVGPLVQQLASERQPVFTRDDQFNGHNVNLMVREELQGLRR